MTNKKAGTIIGIITLISLIIIAAILTALMFRLANKIYSNDCIKSGYDYKQPIIKVTENGYKNCCNYTYTINHIRNSTCKITKVK